jgi:hypothetical protein
MSLCIILPLFPLTSLLRQRKLTSGRRAWNSLSFWARGLRSLRHLECFDIKTPAQLVARPGNMSEEMKLIFRWLTGSRDFPGDFTIVNDSQFHPTLRSFSLWYNITKPEDGVLSRWYRDAISWQRVVHTASTFDTDVYF